MLEIVFAVSQQIHSSIVGRIRNVYATSQRFRRH